MFSQPASGGAQKSTGVDTVSLTRKTLFFCFLFFQCVNGGTLALQPDGGSCCCSAPRISLNSVLELCWCPWGASPPSQQREAQKPIQGFGDIFLPRINKLRRQKKYSDNTICTEASCGGRGVSKQTLDVQTVHQHPSARVANCRSIYRLLSFVFINFHS